MKRYLITTLVLTGLSLHAFDAKLEFRHREAQGVGYNQGYSTIEFIGNRNWNKLELLINLRGHVFNNGKLAANGGFGLRKPLKSERYLIGLNAFYDVRQTSDFTPQQIGVGGEFLSKHADLRINGYLPISKQTDFEQRSFSEFSGNSLYVSQKAQAALPCAEIELGIPIKSMFYLAGGPYYLFEKNVRGMETGKSWGGRLRASINFAPFLSLSAIVTHDGIFNTRYQGTISFDIPLHQVKAKKPIKRCLRNIPLTRNEIIPIEKKHRKVPLASITTTNDLTSIIFVNNAFIGIGKGTFEEPYTSLKEAEQGSNPGDIIYVFPGDGTTHNMDEGIILKDGQYLRSSAEALVIDEVIVPPQTPHQKPAITNIHTDQPIITNSHDSYSESAFTVIDPSDYVFPDWDNTSYEVSDSTPLLGGDSSGDVVPVFSSEDLEIDNPSYVVDEPNSSFDSDHSGLHIDSDGFEDTPDSGPASSEHSSEPSHDSFEHIDTSNLPVDASQDTAGSWWPW